MENGLRTTGYLTMTRIQRKLQQLKSDGKKAFVAYITLGDPDLESTSQLVLALERAGVDIIELGVPFSDPLADGPVIQRASERALRNGFTLRKGLGLVSELRRKTELPLVLFSYYNPLFSYGFESLARQARTEGVDGFLITDLSVEEAQAPAGILRETGLDTIFLAAPTSTQKRIEAIAHFSSAFIYAVSRTGVTGMQNSVSEEVVPLVARIRVHSDLPVVVGFGISHPEQVREIDLHADGVVVGSAIVRCIEKNLGEARLAEKVAEFTCWLKGGG
jgi:tryptophan synthase alpha chain